MDSLQRGSSVFHHLKLATSDLATVVRAALAQAGVSDVISVDVTEGPPRACSQASQSNKTRRWALNPRSIDLAKARTDAPPTFKRRSLAADDAAIDASVKPKPPTGVLPSPRQSPRAAAAAAKKRTAGAIKLLPAEDWEKAKLLEAMEF